MIATDSVLFQYGNCFFAQCLYENGLKYLEESLRLQEECYGHENTRAAECLISIAGIYSDQGALEKSTKYCDDALNVYEKLYGHDHVGVANCTSRKAFIFSKLGQFEKALEMQEEAYLFE